MLLKNGQCDVCTGRCSPAKESGFPVARKERPGLNRIVHPDWVKLSVELNLRAKPKYEIFLYFICNLHEYNGKNL